MFATTDMIMEQESDLRDILDDAGWSLHALQIVCDYTIDKRGPGLLRDAIVEEIMRTPKKKLLLCSSEVKESDFCPGRYELWAQYTDDHLMHMKIRFISTVPGVEYIKRDAWTEPMHNIWNFMLGEGDSYSDHFSWVGPSVHQYTSISTNVCDSMMDSLSMWKHKIIAREATVASARSDQMKTLMPDPFHHKPGANEKSQSYHRCCKAARVIMSEPSYNRNQEVSAYATWKDTIDPFASWCITVRGYLVTAIEYDGCYEKSKITFDPDSLSHVVKGVCIWPFICDDAPSSPWDEAIQSFDSQMKLEDIHAAMRLALKETLGPQIREDVAMFRKCAPHKSADEYNDRSILCEDLD